VSRRIPRERRPGHQYQCGRNRFGPRLHGCT
jgi:hypothetical protein